ncbi:uncharacterized protein LOC108864964 [Galendromus occidentalis]|uniref:Uncharacterized protein LOC108864964 n=1 Tax=Galendromus occidentalis TaxID=34638 RepID=A0AAJ7L772_9ACAR|nr:uncharacterized protein LOC108864964 [Galendromus occidentalis]
MGFREVAQSEGETLQEFGRRLRRDAEFCDWKQDGSLFDNLIEQFLRDLRDSHIREYVLKKAANFKTSDDAVKEGETVSERKFRLEVFKTFERSAKNDTRSWKNASPETSGILKNTSYKKNGFFNEGHCYRCGLANHKADTCRFKDTECRKCKIQGHLERVCQNAENITTKPCYSGRIRTVTKRAYAITTQRPDVPPIKMEVEIGGGTATMELDSGCGIP